MLLFLILWLLLFSFVVWVPLVAHDRWRLLASPESKKPGVWNTVVVLYGGIILVGLISIILAGLLQRSPFWSRTLSAVGILLAGALMVGFLAELKDRSQKLPSVFRSVRSWIANLGPLPLWGSALGGLVQWGILGCLIVQASSGSISELPVGSILMLDLYLFAYTMYVVLYIRGSEANPVNLDSAVPHAWVEHLKQLLANDWSNAEIRAKGRADVLRHLTSRSYQESGYQLAQYFSSEDQTVKANAWDILSILETDSLLGRFLSPIRYGAQVAWDRQEVEIEYNLKKQRIRGYLSGADTVWKKIRFSKALSLTLKRFWLDLPLSFLLLVLLAPAIMVIVVRSRLRGGEPFFLETYLGMDLEDFRYYRFNLFGGKSFPMGASSERSSSILEWVSLLGLERLPALVNVMAGEMSIIGPRPRRLDCMIATHELLREKGMSKESSGELLLTRLAVPPGLTGESQLKALFRPELATTQICLFWDYIYATQWSFWRDIPLMLQTLLAESSIAWNLMTVRSGVFQFGEVGAHEVVPPLEEAINDFFRSLNNRSREALEAIIQRLKAIEKAAIVPSAVILMLKQFRNTVNP